MLTQFLKYLTSHEALCDALRAEDDRKALKMIAQGQEVIARARYGAYTFLQTSLLAGKPACTVALLEYGADPNAHPQGILSQGSTVEEEFMLERVNNIKLLMLYGGQVDINWLEKIKKSFKYELIKKLVEDKQRTYPRIKHLQDSITDKTPKEHLLVILQELAQLWKQEALEERTGEPVYRQHYEKKAAEYERRALELEAELAGSRPDYNVENQETALNSNQQERDPLLKKVKNH